MKKEQEKQKKQGDGQAENEVEKDSEDNELVKIVTERRSTISFKNAVRASISLMRKTSDGREQSFSDPFDDATLR